MPEVPIKFIKLTEQFFNIGKSCLCINNKYTQPFSITRGVRQGDPLSGCLFVLAMEPLLKTLEKKKTFSHLKSTTDTFLIRLTISPPLSDHRTKSGLLK